MSKQSLGLSEQIHEYLLSVSLREAPELVRLREETSLYPNANMQISPEQGQFMALLIKLIGASRCIEVGVFTGYSSLAMALALPEDGKITACDISEEYTQVARRYWKEARVEQKFDLRIAPAMETLEALLKAGEAGTYDFVFVDADKESYPDYYESSLKLLRSGGVVALDNTLWDGRTADPSNMEPDTVAIREFNELLLSDSRVDISLVPIGDGLTLARKR